MIDAAIALEDLARNIPDAEFLERGVAAAKEPTGVAFRALYASVARRLGRAAGEAVMSPAPFAERARPHFTLTDWVRLTLVFRAFANVSAQAQPALIERLFESGEIGEQESLLRTLALLPEPARFTDTGLAACRTNARRVFDAIACDNPFPAEFFPELGFNQMLLKAVFIEAPVARIEGLAARRTPELLRMARDYASERTAAGRPVPDDIALILGETSV
jgi:hypothetical protein